MKAAGTALGVALTAGAAIASVNVTALQFPPQEASYKPAHEANRRR
jgi:hypothetical protein